MSNDTIRLQERILLSKVFSKKGRKALGRLHSIYYLRLRRYITLHVNSFEDAEDITQNLFVELCQGNGHYDCRRDAEAYLFGMARNLIVRYHRKKRKHLQTVRNDSTRKIVANCDVQQYPPVLSSQLKKLLEDATMQLTPKAKDAIRARLIEGLSSKEAAQRCGCSIDAFYKRFDAALKALEVMRETGSLKFDCTANL